eukprot:748716-Hanusia_phi.AAC.3
MARGEEAAKFGLKETSRSSSSEQREHIGMVVHAIARQDPLRHALQLCEFVFMVPVHLPHFLGPAPPPPQQLHDPRLAVGQHHAVQPELRSEL